MEQGFLAEDLAELVVRDDYRTEHNDLHHVFMRQRWHGIDVWNGDIAVHIDANDNVLKVNNGAWSRMAKRVNATVPLITAQVALETVLRGDKQRLVIPSQTSFDPSLQRYTFDDAEFNDEPVTVQLVLQPVEDRLRLVWNVNYYQPSTLHWWNVRVDALTGKELDRNDWVSQCAFDRSLAEARCVGAPEAAPAPPAAPNDYRVLPWPVESPSHGSRAIRNAPWTAGGIASPYGWHDTNGAVGAEFTVTRGNNVRAVEDADANNTPGYSPTSATLDFDYAIDFAQAPTTYRDAAITNLFYWNNLMHDVWYKYGFNEVAGNFQSNNYGRGGAGSDFVNADAQDGSGVDNANFATPADGSQPRMQMYLWDVTAPQRDGDLDNGIIAHEYTHGISNRLVGGPSNVNCLNNAEQMGEGWSDWFALMMTIEPGDQGTDGRGVGTYVLGQPVTGPGIRPARYSTLMSVNGFTYASTNGMTDPHDVGFVWCTMLWELTWELVSHYGLDPDIYNGTGGNNLAMQLVVDGLKLTPCSPGFVQARDAILQADMANNGGANQAYIWAAFAKRGLGQGAAQGSSNNLNDQVESYTTPYPANVGIVSIIEPVQGTLFDCNTTPLSVRATVRNSGTAAQSNFPVRYQLDGGIVITENYPGSLAAGATATYVFTTPLLISGAGTHALSVSTALAGDAVSSNDVISTTVSVTTGTTANMPFSEGVNAGQVTPAGWTLQNPDASITWATMNVTNGAGCAATNVWAFDNFDYNGIGQEDRLLTPMVELGGSAGVHLVFDHAYAQYAAAYTDGLRVDISTNCGGNWTQLYAASGAALATAGSTTSAFLPTNCSQWAHHDIDLSAYDGKLVIIRFTNINDYGNYLYLDNVALTQSGLRLSLRMMLEGPFDGTSKMNTGLMTASLVPMNEPYTALGFTQASDGGGETMLSSAVSNTGDNTIVDWVQVELRNATTPSTIVATRPALLQRDGDVVDVNGTSPVALLAAPGSYKVAVRHRNHLGCMAADPVALNTTTTASIDFTAPATTAYGTEARTVMNGVALLWAGNALRNAQLGYTGASNDRDPILVAVGSTQPNNLLPGYRMEDTNLDGVVKYTGAGNDRDPILVNVGSTTPNNIRVEQLP